VYSGRAPLDRHSGYEFVKTIEKALEIDSISIVKGEGSPEDREGGTKRWHASAGVVAFVR
jgi:hypothetical protein